MNRLLSLLEKGAVVADGGMGSLIYQALPSAPSFEAVNLTHPDVVLGIHLKYLRAGAQLIETNTFGANRVKLALHGLEDRVRDINSIGVKLAREARDIAGQEALIGGSIGPIGRLLDLSDPQEVRIATAAFEEQIASLEERGVDLFVLETFPSLDELVLAAETLRRMTSLPFVTMLTFTESGRTLTGATPRDALDRLLPLKPAALGTNCSLGPQEILAILQKIRFTEGVYLAVMPNVGLPQRVGDRVIYPASSTEYFAAFAREALRLGARLIGGCCGTTPRHIQAIAQEVHSDAPQVESPFSVIELVEEETAPVEAANDVSRLARKLQAREFVLSLQVDPPKGIVTDRIVEAARRARNREDVDTIDINSGSLGRPQLDSLWMAQRIERETGMETIPHLTTRDASVLGLQGLLLGAYSIGGIRNVLAITGDPPRVGDYPEARGVYEIDSIGLVRLLAQLNAGRDWAGQVTGAPTRFTIGVALNPTSDDLDHEMARFEEKLAHGAQFAMTQTLFDPEILARFLSRLGPPPVPLIVGVWPLSSFRQAQRLHHEVAGIVVPEPIRRALESAGGDAKREGYRIARDMYQAARETAAGAYIVLPFKRVEEVDEVLGRIVD